MTTRTTTPEKETRSTRVQRGTTKALNGVTMDLVNAEQDHRLADRG
ncbi:hypothetical protein M1D89_00760 (plasmid) [Arthrobacter sp. D3-18]